VLHKVVQVRLYPSLEQQTQLAQAFGCARWWWNYALNKSIETYKETGKGLSRAALNAFLPALKKAEETIWLSECYSQVLQATTLNLTTAYKNFFEKRAGFPKFKSRHGKQSIQYPQIYNCSLCSHKGDRMIRMVENGKRSQLSNYLTGEIAPELFGSTTVICTQMTITS
jgi:transposase